MKLTTATIAALFTLSLAALAQNETQREQLFNFDDIQKKAAPVTSPKPKAAERQTAPTEIWSDEGEFDNKSQTAVFTGQVVVKDTQFRMSCQKLTAFLADSAAKSSKPKTPNAPAKDGVVIDPAKGASGLNKVIAEGDVIIVQEARPGSEDVTVARAKRAVYEAKTGDLVLYGRPVVQQGASRCEAVTEDTIITVNRDGKMTFTGKAVTRIMTGKDAPLDR